MSKAVAVITTLIYFVFVYVLAYVLGYLLSFVLWGAVGRKVVKGGRY